MTPELQPVSEACIGDVVEPLNGRGPKMLVVDVRPGDHGLVASWRHPSGQVFESWFPARELRLLRRMKRM